MENAKQWYNETLTVFQALFPHGEKKYFNLLTPKVSVVRKDTSPCILSDTSSSIYRHSTYGHIYLFYTGIHIYI